MLCLEKALLSFDWQNIIGEEFEVWTLVPTVFEHETISVLGSVCVCVCVLIEDHFHSIY